MLNVRWKMDEQERLAHNLVSLRKASGLTQVELAEKIKYSNKTVSKWERAEGYPDIFTLKKIAEVYGVTVDELLEGVSPSCIAEAEHKITSQPDYAVKKGLLVMACGLLGCMTSVAFFLMLFVVGAGNTPVGKVIVSAFNADGYAYWNFFIYNIPLDAAAFFVFYLKVHGRAEKWCLTTMLWGSLLSLHLSIMQYSSLTALIYILGIPFQIFLTKFSTTLNIVLKADTPVKKKPESETKKKS